MQKVGPLCLLHKVPTCKLAARYGQPQRRCEWKCVQCMQSAFNHVRVSFVLCLRRVLPGLRDLHRLLSSDRYLPFPWLETAHWGDCCLSIFMRRFRNDKPNLAVECLVIDYVDRGVGYFEDFALMLRHLFPNIRRLEWKQNYTWPATFVDFVDFVRRMRLERLYLRDMQSDIFGRRPEDEEDDEFPPRWPTLLSAMPENATYWIESFHISVTGRLVSGTKTLVLRQWDPN